MLASVVLLTSDILGTRLLSPVSASAPPEMVASNFEPRPGRLCVFFSQEVEHQVLTSQGDRFALTLWIWDTKKDATGR